MNIENKKQQVKQQDPANESQKEIKSSPQSEPRISEDIKKLLNSLIKRNLEKRSFFKKRKNSWVKTFSCK